MSFNGHYAPQETSLFDEQMSAFEPSFADPSMNVDASDAYPVVDATTTFRPPSADGLYQPYQPSHAGESATGSRVSSPLPTFSGTVAPFSQVYSNHLSPFSASGSFPPIASTSSVPPSYPTFPAGVGVPPASTLAVQAAIHQQQRGVVQQHPGFLDPRQQAELLQTHQGGIAPATITPSQVQQPQSFSIASTPSTSASPPPPPPAASSKGTKSSSSSSSKSSSSSNLKKVNGASSSAGRAKQRPPSAFPAPPPASAVKYEYDPEEWQQILPGVRTLLSAKRLQASPLATAPKLLKDLRFFSHETRADSPWGDTSDVPPEGRAEVLKALLKYAKDEFWRVFLETGQGKPASSSTVTTTGSKGKGKENGDDQQQQQQLAGIKSDALDLLQAWLEGASKAVLREKGSSSGTSEKDRRRKELEQATLVLVLQVLAKMPVEYGHLIEFKKIPKRVKSISEKAADGAVKSAATHLVAKWQKVQERAYSSTSMPSAATAPKRKADSTDVPAKKVKTSATPPPPPSSNAVSKANIAPTIAKAPLPSFKKVPPAAPAQPAFMAAISQMSKPASTTTDNSASTGSQSGNATSTPAAATVPKQKRKKKVHWPADDVDLCKIREIEPRELSVKQAASEEIGGEQHHLMEEQEGQTLGMHLDDDEDEEWEPELEWYEPPGVEIPDSPEFAPLHEPKQSAEVAIQEARESATMEVDLASTSAPPPESPSEDLVPDEPVVDDSDVKTLGLHADLADDPAFHATVAQAQLGQLQSPLAGNVASNDTIANLLGQLAPDAGTLQHHLEAAMPPLPVAIDPAALEQLRHFEPAQIAQIVANTPQFQNLDLSALGVAVGGAQPVPNQVPYGGAGYPPVQQQYQGYAPPPGSQPWGPPPFPQPNNYNGYQPPASMAPPPQPQQLVFGRPPPAPRAQKHQNFANYRTQPCKFFRTPKGCDWGDRCRFLH